jgi:hypothetical protein
MDASACARGAVVWAAALMAVACATAAPQDADAGLRLADREAILGTLDRYTRGLDQLNPDLYVSAWAEDGEVVLYEDEVHSGHEALAGYVEHEAALRAEARERGDERIQFHQYSNQLIEFTGPDTAVHRAYWTASTRGSAGDVEVGFIGRLTDTFVRQTDGTWLIQRREVFADP